MDTTLLHAQELIDAVETRAAELGVAKAKVMELEDGRAAEKSAAVRRIIGSENPETGKPHSASSAEKVVETDAEYASYRRQQYQAVIAEQEAHGRRDAAKLRAELAVGRALAALETASV